MGTLRSEKERLQKLSDYSAGAEQADNKLSAWHLHAVLTIKADGMPDVHLEGMEDTHPTMSEAIKVQGPSRATGCGTLSGSRRGRRRLHLELAAVLQRSSLVMMRALPGCPTAPDPAPRDVPRARSKTLNPRATPGGV